jgi:dGTPase
VPFSKVAAGEGNEKWDLLVTRESKIYQRDSDIRSEFWRDYNRILHCTAYRRLKHKTQVFFATQNDHICTRIEHVNHVAAVSVTLCKRLGLNTELAIAIATGHDLGHPPFGHEGEKILQNIVSSFCEEKFWHEKNSLWFVDKLETLTGPDGYEHNLNLTYAVRDGVITHCGEVDENAIFPRQEYLPLEKITYANQYPPFTWEGCIVKIADKISYLGRDIEDALTLKILSSRQIKALKEMLGAVLGTGKINFREINNTVLMHRFMMDLCQNSDPEAGIMFSEEHLNLINLIKKFNYENIYYHPRLAVFKKYAELIIESIFAFLAGVYCGKKTINELKRLRASFPLLVGYFMDWLYKYSTYQYETKAKYANQIVYDIANEVEYKRAIVDYISGMTDSFAIKGFHELTSF